MYNTAYELYFLKLGLNLDLTFIENGLSIINQLFEQIYVTLLQLSRTI